MDLRCPSKKHAELVDGNVIEVKCGSRFCGARAGVTVLHRFDTKSGELIETRTYSDPGRRANNDRTAVRTA